MIFATLGTHHQQFARFVDALRPVASRTFLQYGHNRPPQGFMRAEAFVPFGVVLDAMAEAEAVVTHAGVGSILCARDAGHVPIVVPRLHRLGEHVDDHQLDLVSRLAADGTVVVLPEGAAIEPLLAGLPPRGTSAGPPPDGELAAAVSVALRAEQGQ